MVKKKQGMPEESDLVLCTVTKVYPHCVFANIDDYENKQGMIHISEISPGRIRNINDYVKIGKKIICKVLKIDLEKGHIDLSLRRVSEGQRREKADLIKKDQKALKIVEFVADKLKIDKHKMYDDLVKKSSQDYDTLHDLFEEFIVDENELQRLQLDKKTYDLLAEVIRQRIKPPEVEIEGEISLKSYAPDGVEVVKNILIAADKTDEAITLRYKGGGAYTINIQLDNYKDAEKIMDKAITFVESAASEKDCQYSFKRIEKKKKASS